MGVLSFGMKWNKMCLPYEYSIVKKLTLYLIRKVGKIYEADKDVVIQMMINPTELSVQSKQADRVQKISVGPQALQESSTAERQEREISIETPVDIYDMYHLVSEGVGFLKASEISLTNKEFSWIPALEDIWRSNDKFLLMTWGSQKFFGKLTLLEVNYRAYSEFGEPLKAMLRFTITERGYEEGADGQWADFFTTKSGIKLRNTMDVVNMAENVALYASLGVEAAR